MNEEYRDRLRRLDDEIERETDPERLVFLMQLRAATARSRLQNGVLSVDDRSDN